MRFGSVCSGIEAASVAWHPLGWQAAWLSEIEPFPSAVLKHHYPDVPNHGDMTKLPDLIRSGQVEAPDLFCGGTPCQAFSVAGLRQSLNDARGNLSLTFCEIADAIDSVRSVRGEPASIVFWENVPGVLSTKDNAFGCFLGALAGSDTAIVPGGGRWTDAGVVAGPKRTVAWRTLDAQYFGLAQRRRRVFVVASAREGFDPAAVLLEWEGLRRDSAPSREAGKAVAPAVTGGAPFSRTGNERVEVDAVSMCLNAGAMGRLDAESETLLPVAATIDATDGRKWGSNQWVNQGKAIIQPVAVAMVNMQGSKGNAVAQADGPSFTLNAMHGHDVHAIAVPFPPTQTPLDDGQIPMVAPAAIVGPLACNTGPNGHDAGNFACNQAVDAGHILPMAFQPVGFDSYNQAVTGDVSKTLDVGQDYHHVPNVFTPHPIAPVVTHSLRGEGFDASEDGTGRGTPLVPVAMRESGQGYWMQDDIAGTLRAEGEDRPSRPSHVIGVPVAFHPTQDPISSTEVCHSIGANENATAAVAAVTGSLTVGHHGCAGHQHRQGDPSFLIPNAMQVRRLTPVECERLQGFPDNYTAIPWRGKDVDNCPDGPRYKALGNSWAVPVVRWIGKRIQEGIA